MRLALPLALAGLAVAGPAQAATVSATPGLGVDIQDPAAEINTISVALVGDTIRVTDTTTPPTAEGVHCADDPPNNAVVCTVSPPDVYANLGGGGDTFTTGDGVDVTVNGGAGGDTITGGNLDDDLLGGSEADQINGGAGTDQIEGGPGNDIERGGPGIDFFNSFVVASGMVIDTDPGDDDLDGQGGSDSLNGGRGRDVMTDSGNDGAKDEVHYGRGDHESFGVNVTMGSGKNDGNDADGLQDDVGAGIEQVVGTGLRDEITGSGNADTLRGRGGDDRLNGALGADTYAGGAGNDTLEARDGVADAVLDCDDTTGDQGTSDTAVVDATGVDPDPVRCEVVDRPSTGGGGGGGGGGSTPAGTTPAQTTGAQPPRTASLPTLTRAGVQLSCAPGAWSGAPTFTYAWFVLGPAGQPAKVADGQRYTLKDSDEGKLVFCAVLASNNGGIGVARSALLLAPTLVRMPELQYRTESFSREKLLKITNGAIVLKTKRKGKANIDCAQGGTRGSESACSTKAAKTARKNLDPGDVHSTTPNDGKVLEADPASGELPSVTLSVYDRSLDVSLPPAGTPKKFGDDCPLTGPGFTTEDRKAFIAGLQGKYESFARTTLDKRECRFKIRDDFNRDQESDPYVGAIQEIEIDDRNGLRLTIERNRTPDLVVIPYHRRLKGTDNFAGANISAGAEIDPGLGSDGDLTTLVRTPNDLCFHVREASTGRPVQGVAVRALDPNGRLVVNRTNQVPVGRSTDEEGNSCEMWPIEERGEYRFTFDWRGSNGVNEEGWLRIDAVDRLRETYTTISGRKLRCTAPDRCEQVGTTGTTARQAVVVEAVILAAVVGVLVKGVLDSKGKGVDQAAASRASAQLAGGDPEVSLFKAAGDGGVTAGFLTSGGKLAPGAGIISGGAGNIIAGGAGNIVASDGASIVSSDGASIVASDGASIVAGGAGNLTSSQGRTVKPGPGGGLIAIGGAGIISGGAGNIVAGGAGNIVAGGAGNLIGQDGAGIVAGGAGNLVAKGDAVTQIGDRSVITSAGQLAPGTSVAAGIGAGTPTSRIVAGGAGN